MVDPVVERAAVAAAVVEARAARDAVLADPTDAVVVAALASRFVDGGAARVALDEQAAWLIDRQVVLVVDGGVTVEDVELGVGPPWVSAAVTACVVESGVYRSTVPATSELVVDVVDRSFRAVHWMVRDDDVWKLDSVVEVGQWPGASVCPPPVSSTSTSTTLDPVAAEQAVVAQRVVEIQAVRLNAYNHLDAAGNEAALSASFTEGGPAREFVERDLRTLREHGWRVRPNPDHANTLTVEDVRLVDGPPATLAEVVACIVDPAVTYEPAGGPHGSDAIVSDEIVAGRVLQRLRIEDGTWQLDEVVVIDEWTGVTQCPPA